MSDVQEQVQDVLDELVASGTERGLQVAAYVEGEPVVDAVAGHADGSGRPVEPGTVFYTYSIGKGAAATLVHQQVDAGRIGYETRVAEVWPEFARHGKDAVTVRHVLTHTAGVPGLPPDVSVEDICRWETMTRALEDAPSELDWSAMGLPDDAPILRAVPTHVFPSATLGNDPRVVAADIPAGGKVSARAVAKMYAALVGEVDGVRLVTPERLAELRAPGSSGRDEVFGNESAWALGYALGVPWGDDRAATGSRVFGMAGAGGSWAGADPERGLALAVTKNTLTNDFDAVARVGRLVLDAV
jgi:CubicO group peptidase (beta-lactamase class C family)